MRVAPACRKEPMPTLRNRSHPEKCEKSSRNLFVRSGALLVAAALAPALVPAQTPPDLNTVIERLDRLEQQNRELTDEIRRLRSELERARTPETPEAAPLAERVAVNEQRIDDQAQTKVEASQKYPLRLTGMFLFNSYINSEYGG